MGRGNCVGRDGIMGGQARTQASTSSTLGPRRRRIGGHLAALELFNAGLDGLHAGKRALGVGVAVLPVRRRPAGAVAHGAAADDSSGGPGGPAVALEGPWGGRKCDLADPLVGVVGNIHRTAAAAGKRGDGHCVWWWAWGGHTHKPLGHKHTQKRTAQEQPVVLRLFLHL